MNTIVPKVTTKFTCDTCHKKIIDPSEGFVQWIQTDIGKMRFSIVHKVRRCFIARPSADVDLSTMLSSTGILHLDSWIDPTTPNEYAVTDLESYWEIRRRLTYPLYEEAHLYMQQAIQDGFLNGYNEIMQYTPDTLQGIIDYYS